MKGIQKKQAKNAITKAISILVVLFLLSTALSTTVNAGRLFDRLNDRSDRPVEKLLNSLSIRDRISSLRERMNNFLERVRELKNDLKEEVISKIDDGAVSALNKLGILSSSSSLQFYTKYKDIITETTLKIFRETKVDINTDGVDDFGVRYTIGLGVADLGLSINFKYQFRKLEGYNSLDKNAEFEGYVEIFFPGLLAQDLEGDRLRFGIESPDGEKIPEDLLIVYKFIPHLLSFKKKAGHMFYLNPGVDSGRCELNLTTSFAEMNGNSVTSEVKSKVLYDPIVESEIKMSGTRSLADSTSTYTYERVRDGGSVDLFVQFTDNGKSIVAYAKNLPNKVTYTSSISGTGKGLVEFNAYGASVDELGVCDDFGNPVNRVYFSNMFEYAKLEWYTNLIGNGKVNISAYTEGSGVSLNAYVQGAKGVASFSASPSGSMVDCSLELDTRVGYLVLNRNDFDIEVSFDVEVTNESLSGYLSTLQGSFNLKKTGGQLKVTFDDLFDGNAVVHVSGKTIEVDDLVITGNSPILGGDFIVSMDYFKKEFLGDIVSTLVVSQVENNITGTCSFEVTSDVNITGLLIRFGDYTILEREYLNVSSYWYTSVEFTVAVALVEWNVAPDFSSGYVLIESSSYLSFSFFSEYYDDSVLLGEVSGSIILKTTSDVFNISWGTVDGNFSMNFDGSGLVKLEDFYLYLKDMAEVSIPLIKGTFDINTNDKSGEILLQVDLDTLELHLNIDEINITDLLEITLKGSFDIDIDSGSADGFLYIAWNESGLSTLETDFDLGVSGTIEINDFEFSYQQTFVDVSFDSLLISGDLAASIVKNESEISLVAQGPLTEINVTGLQAYVGYQILGIDIADITFSGGGEFSFVVDLSESLILATVDLYADNSEILVNVLWIDAVLLVLGFIGIEISGPVTITIDLDTSSDDNLLELIIDPDEEDIYCEHVNLGPSIIELWDVSGGAGDGDYLGIYAGVDHPGGLMGFMPVIHFDGLWTFGEFYLMESPIVSDLTVEGSISIEFWFDPLKFTYFYLEGVAYDETTINIFGIDITIEPCNFNIMFQQNVFNYLPSSMFNPGASWFVYIVADVLSWVTISVPDMGEVAKFYGFLDLRLDVAIGDDGKWNVLLDLRNVDGLFILSDAIRIAADVENVVFDLSCYFINEEGTISISDLDLYISGTFDAVIWLKPSGEDDWIPFTPFPVTDGAVSLLVNEKIKKPVKNQVPNNSKTHNFKAWYSPPINVSGGGSEIYTYNISYGDGTYGDEIVTSDTEVTFDPHEYSLGEYTVRVTVSVDGLQVYDECLIIVIEGGYVSQTVVSPNKISQIYGILSPMYILNYEEAEAEDDGNFHIQMVAKNNADEDHPYELHWEADVVFGANWEGDPWTFDPPSGILYETEEQLINITAPPPYDHKDHIVWPGTAWPGLNNTNYSLHPDEEDGSGYEVKVFDGYVWVNPVKSANTGISIKMPDLKPGEPRASGFVIKNVYSKTLNWSIDTSALSNNGSWEFSSISGTITPYGSAPVYFNVTANAENLTLDSYINVTNQNDSSDFDTLFIKVKSIGVQQSLPPGVEITENGDDVTVKIGGYNIVEIDDLYINQMFLNGIFTLDFDDDWVYINYSKTGQKNLSIEGTGEFSVTDFILKYGEMSNPNISIDVSYLAGEFEFRKGHSGNLFLVVDESSTNVNIEIAMDYGGTNLTIQGDFDIYISGEADGALWFDWDLNGATPVIAFGGDLYREGTFTISVLNLLLELDGVIVTADGLMLSGSGANITVSGEEISISAGIETALVNNLILDVGVEEFPLVNAPVELHGVFDITGNIGLTFLLGEEGAIEIEVDGDTSVSISNFILDINNSKLMLSMDSLLIYAGADLYIGTAIDLSSIEIYIDEPTYLDISSFDLVVNNGVLSLGVASLYVEGYGSLTLGKEGIEIDASLTSLDITALDLSINSKKLSLSGDLDLSLSGTIYLKVNKELGYFEINMDQGQGTVHITNLEFGAINGKINASATSVSASLSASGYLIFDDKNLTASASGTLTANIQGFSLDIENGSHMVDAKLQLSLNLNADLIKIYIDKSEPDSTDSGGFRLDIEGAWGSFVLQNVNITYTNEDMDSNYHRLTCDYLGIALTGPEGYIELIDTTLTIDAIGQLDILVTNLIFMLNTDQIMVEIPSLDLLIGANVGKLIICDSSSEGSNGGDTRMGNSPPSGGGGLENPDADIYLKLTADLSLTGTLQDITIVLENGKPIEISVVSGSGSLVVNDLDVTFTLMDIGGLSLICDYLYLGLTAGGTFVVEDSVVTIDGTGDVDLLITDLYLALYGTFSIGNNGFSGDISLSIPSIDVELTAGADELKIGGSEAPKVNRVLPSNSSIYIGDTLQLVALVNIPEYQNQVEWESSNPAIATVDPNTGEVTAVSSGTVTIDASLDGGGASATVNVIGSSSNFHIIPEMATLNVGDQFKLTTKNAAGTVSWESLDEDVATVNETGVVTVNAIGTAIIQANDGSSSDTATIISPKKETSEYDIVIKGDIVVSGSGSASLNIVESMLNATIELDLINVDVSIDNFYLSVNETKSIIGDGWGGTTTKQVIEASWATCDLDGVYFFLSLQDGFKISASSNSLTITEFSLGLGNSFLECESIYVAGQLTLETLSNVPYGATDYFGLYGDLDVVLEIENIASNIVVANTISLDILDNIYIDADGDLEFKRWNDSLERTHLYAKSVDGISVDTFSIELDNSIIFKIEGITGQGQMSSGYAHLEFKKGSGDGYIWLDSSYITFDDIRLILYRTDAQGWGVRIKAISGYFDANAWSLQWDYTLIGSLYIPFNPSFGGSINGDLDIDVTDGTNWYNVYPEIL